MEIRQLEYFAAVADEMNFSRAAQRVHVVQSALSTSVGKLEKELGVELFDRSRQKIRITPAGELFLDHARRVIRAARVAGESIREYRGELSGNVEFGVLVAPGQLDLPRILGEFHRNYPLVRIRLRQSQSQIGLTAYLNSVADGTFDLALVSAPDSFPARVEMRPLCQEPLHFVCRSDHRLAHRDSVELADVAEEDLIGWPAEFGLRRVVEDVFDAAGLAPRFPYEVAADFTFAAGLVRAGLGSVFMPASAAGAFPDLHAVPMRPAPVWQIFLAWAAHGQRSPASAKLAELILASVEAG